MVFKVQLRRSVAVMALRLRSAMLSGLEGLDLEVVALGLGV